MAASTWSLPAKASLEQAEALLSSFDAAIAAVEPGSALAIDASSLAEFDTSAIALLLHAQRAAAPRRIELRLAGEPGKLRELARLYGVEALLPQAAG